jgi:hypothetical protein
VFHLSPASVCEPRHDSFHRRSCRRTIGVGRQENACCASPQVPRLMFVDLANSGGPGKAILRRLGSHAVTRNVPTVLFSARLTPLAELEGAACVSMDILKPVDCEEYDLKVASVLDKWLVHRS